MILCFVLPYFRLLPLPCRDSRARDGRGVPSTTHQQQWKRRPDPGRILDFCVSRCGEGRVHKGTRFKKDVFLTPL